MEDTLRIKLEVEGGEFEQGMKSAKESIDDVGGSASGISSILGKISPNLSKAFGNIKTAFTSMKGNLGGVKEAFGSMKEGAAGMSGMASAAGSLVAALGPVIAIITAIVAGVMLLKKAWDLMKKAFKAWDPTGYGKTFGTFQREIRKLMTALGSLTAGPVKDIMTFATGIIRIVRQTIEGIAKVKAWLDGFLDSLGGIFDGIAQGFSTVISVLNPGFSMAWDTITKSGKEAAEEVGEVWSEEMSVGLASFDKLNNIGMEEGDMDERIELAEELEKATQDGKDFLGGIVSWFEDFGDTLGDIWADISKTMGDFWDDFTEGVGNAWDGFVTWAGSAWDAVSKFAGDTWEAVTHEIGNAWADFVAWGSSAWNSVTSAAMNAWNGIASTVGGVWDGFVKTATRAWTEVQRLAGSIWNGITEAISSAWTGFVSFATSAWNTVNNIATGIWNGITSTISDLWQFFADAGKKAWQVIDTAGEWFNKNILGPINEAIDWIAEKVDAILGWVNDIIGAVSSFLGFGSGSSKSSSTSTASRPSADTTTIESGEQSWSDMMAASGLTLEGFRAMSGNLTQGQANALESAYKSGGASGVREYASSIGYGDYFQDELKKKLKGAANGEVFAPNNPVLRVLGDNTKEHEVAAPYSMIVSAVTTALNNMNIGREVGGSGASDRNIDITLNIDGKKLARMTYDYNENERIRRNGSNTA